MKISILKGCVALSILVTVACNTEKTWDSKADKEKSRKANNKKQSQSAGSESARVQGSNDTCTTCCDPLLEIDPKLLVPSKN